MASKGPKNNAGKNSGEPRKPDSQTSVVSASAAGDIGQQKTVSIQQLIDYWLRRLSEEESRRVLDAVLSDQQLYERWLVVADLVREGRRQAEERKPTKSDEWPKPEQSKGRGDVQHEVSLATALGDGAGGGNGWRVTVPVPDCEFSADVRGDDWEPAKVVVAWLGDGSLKLRLRGSLMTPPGGATEATWQTTDGATCGPAADPGTGVLELTLPQRPATGDRLTLVQEDASGTVRLRWQWVCDQGRHPARLDGERD